MIPPQGGQIRVQDLQREQRFSSSFWSLSSSGQAHSPSWLGAPCARDVKFGAICRKCGSGRLDGAEYTRLRQFRIFFAQARFEKKVIASNVSHEKAGSVLLLLHVLKVKNDSGAWLSCTVEAIATEKPDPEIQG